MIGSEFEPEIGTRLIGRLLLDEIKRRVKREDSFAIETTLSGRNYARMIPGCRGAGYHVKLIFLTLPSADLAVARVHARVTQGGHFVPEEVIRRRFDSGLRNFNNLYRQLVDSWILYDSSDINPCRVTSGDHT